jgi:hypothetical protein
MEIILLKLGKIWNYDKNAQYALRQQGLWRPPQIQITDNWSFPRQRKKFLVYWVEENLPRQPAQIRGVEVFEIEFQTNPQSTPLIASQGATLQVEIAYYAVKQEIKQQGAMLFER